MLRLRQLGMDPTPIWDRIPQLLTFAIPIEAAMIGVGVYARDAMQSFRYGAARLLVAISLGVILISLLYFIAPGATLWRSNSVYSMVLAVVLLLAVRVLLGGFVALSIATPAHAAGSSMPWEAPLQSILDSVQGPVAKIVAVMIIIATGLALAFGDTSGGSRRLIQIVFGLSIAFAASSFFLSFFSFGGGALV